MEVKVGENPRARRRIFAILNKPEGGVQTPPPPSRAGFEARVNSVKNLAKMSYDYYVRVIHSKFLPKIVETRYM